MTGHDGAEYAGVPQRNPLSPLLANIYLDKLDKELEKRELSFCRYVDDLMVYAGSERSAKRILASLTQWIDCYATEEYRAVQSQRA